MLHLSELRSLQQLPSTAMPAGITEFILLPFVGQEAPKPCAAVWGDQPVLADALPAVARIFGRLDSQSSAQLGRLGLPVPQLLSTGLQRYRRHVDGGTHYHNGWRSRWHLYGSRDFTSCYLSLGRPYQQRDTLYRLA